jgi:hypothetical protein
LWGKLGRIPERTGDKLIGPTTHIKDQQPEATQPKLPRANSSHPKGNRNTSPNNKNNSKNEKVVDKGIDTAVKASRQTG